MATAIASQEPHASIPPPRRLLIADIEPDEDQPRKTFDEAKLKELAESIKVHGVIVPIEVRANPKKAGKYKLISGERRWRASKLAGVLDIPAVAKTGLTDKEVLERQLIENSHREDILPLEEGETFKALIEEHDYSMEQLIAKTGKSRAVVYDRIKLTKLPAGVKKLLAEGKLAASIAELATRIHDPKLQEQFVKECLGEGKHDAYQLAGLELETVRDDGEPGKRQTIDQPLSHRAASTLLRRRYMLRLVEAKFSTQDAALVPKAGSCTACPKRSGNQPQLPGLAGVADADDLCTDPACFEDKTGAAWRNAAAAAKARQQEVVPAAKAKNFFGYRDELRDDAPVAALDTPLPYNLRKPGSNATIGKLLGREVANVPKILVQDPSGAPVEMLDKDAAIKKLRELGKLDEAKKQKKSGTSKAERETLKKANDKAEKESELREATEIRILEQVVAGAAKDIASSKETAFWRWLAHCFFSLDEIEYGVELDLVGHRRGVGSAELDSQIDKLKTGGEVRALIIECLICRDSGQYASPDAKARYKDGLKLFGVDVAKAAAAAKEAQKAEEAAEAAKKKGKATDDGKRCGLVNGKKGDGCIHELGHDGPHSNGKQTWNDPKKKGGRK